MLFSLSTAHKFFSSCVWRGCRLWWCFQMYRRTSGKIWWAAAGISL